MSERSNAPPPSTRSHGTRITFQGKQGVAGFCKHCNLLMLIMDTEPDGSYQTFHQHPMCQPYLDSCSGPRTTALPPDVYTMGVDIQPEEGQGG